MQRLGRRGAGQPPAGRSAIRELHAGSCSASSAAGVVPVPAPAGLVLLSPMVVRHLLAALRLHLRKLRADGITPPAEVLSLVDALIALDMSSAGNGPERTRLAPEPPAGEPVAVGIA